MVGGWYKKQFGAIMVVPMRMIIIIVGQTRKGAILSPHECENGDSYDNCDDSDDAAANDDDDDDDDDDDAGRW